jgi:hypothetical protein
MESPPEDDSAPLSPFSPLSAVARGKESSAAVDRTLPTSGAQETPNILSPPTRPPPPPPSTPRETTKPTPQNGSAQNNHGKAGTSGPNTSVIGPGETPLGKKALTNQVTKNTLQITKNDKRKIGTLLYKNRIILTGSKVFSPYNDLP